MQQSAARDEKFDLRGMVADLKGLIRQKTTMIGIKMRTSMGVSCAEK